MYDVLELRLKFATRNFSSFRLKIVSGGPSHTLFQAYFRIVFTLFLLLFLICFVWRLRPLEVWHVAQKLTIPLVFLRHLFCNPAYVVHAYRPSQVFTRLNSVFSVFFRAYFRFFLLGLFDLFRYRNRKPRALFWVPKIFYLVAQASVSLAAKFAAGPLIEGDFIDTAMHPTQIVEMVVAVSYFCWLFWLVLAASCYVDVVDRYKFHFYVVAAGNVLGMIAMIEGVIPALKSFETSSLTFVMPFAVINIFVLLMVYCHWPYERVQDQTYFDSTDKGAAVPPAAFLPNADSD
jgi:hypothetical protein